MSEGLERTAATEQERRRQLDLRTAFDAAFVMIEPFFDPQQGWAGQSLELLAYRVLRENFPALSSDEVHTLVVAAHRVFIERHPEHSSHLPRPSELRRVNF
ncbi:hypothetical protein [Candidatus Accumulibacter sp. ACC007]|uniref:hypothetical protein n=1 Tax=Candidatus Accumulibacter sp. ACC007 TaxID=2823333 RepID=UPI0025C0BC6C|nr:hypothetical protein [Candidatus Accumulibacter sp. ACC007]